MLENRDEQCPLWFGSDFSAIAVSYAQLAGTLAGFAFVAITLIMNRSHRGAAESASPASGGRPQPLSPEEREQDERVLIALICSFLSLVLAAVEYAFLSGERGCSLVQGRAASAEILGGVAFVFAVNLLLYALVQLLSTSAKEFARGFRFLVVVLIPGLALLFLISGLTDLSVSLGDPEKRIPLQPTWDRSRSASGWLPGVLVSLGVAFWVAGRRTRKNPAHPRAVVAWSLTNFPYLPLALSVLAIGWSVSLPNTDPDTHISPAAGWVIVFVGACVLLMQSALLSFESGIEHAPPERRPSRSWRMPTRGELAAAVLAAFAVTFVSRMRRR